MFVKKKGKSISKKFITYNGYVEELNLIKNTDGKWFRAYVLDTKAYNPEAVKKIFPKPGYRLQILADRERIMILIGVKADLPEDADKMLSIYDTTEHLQVLPVKTWFDYMGLRLTGEDFPGFPDPQKERHKKAIERVMPYDVNEKQAEMDISGKEVKTLLLMGYPSKVFPAFTTELLSVPGEVTISLHVTFVDPVLCLEGLNIADNIRPARKETMRNYLEYVVKEGKELYQVALLISISGEGDSMQHTFKCVTDICDKYLTGYSELDFQQKQGFVSTLPLLQNKIDYNIVLSGNNLSGLCPWSELRDKKHGVCYGIDSATGEVQYERFGAVNGESGFILSSDTTKSYKIIKKEIVNLANTGRTVTVLTDSAEFADDLRYDMGENEQNSTDRELHPQTASAELYKKMVIHWARNCAMTNGQLPKNKSDQIKKAAEIEATSDFLEMFINRIDDFALKSALKVRPFPQSIVVHCITVNGSEIFLVKGTEVEKTLAYAYLLEKYNGIIYVLNMELLSSDDVALFIPKDGSVYTYSASNLGQFYRAKSTNSLFDSAEFFFFGAHTISDKLALFSILGNHGMYLLKDEKKWISEPASGSLMISRLVSYMLKEVQ